MRRVKYIILPVVMLAAVYGAFTFLRWAYIPKGYRYLLPTGYKGWVRVAFKVPGAPALPVEGGYRLVQFSNSGVLETSDSPLLGSAWEEVYFVDGDDHRSRAPSFSNHHTVEERPLGGRCYFEMFMGTEADYEQVGKTFVAPGLHRTGAIAR